MHVNGCGEDCAVTKHHLDIADTLRYHEHFDSHTQTAKKQWVLDYLVMNSSGEGEQHTIHFLVCGKPVCLTVWLATLGVSQSYFYGVRSLFLRGHKQLISQVYRNPTEKTSEAMAWMHNFVSLMGDRMPDRATIHLPSCLSKLSVYQRMCKALKERGKTTVISQSQFFEIWKCHFSRVVIPKVCILIPNLNLSCIVVMLMFNFCRRTDLRSVTFVSLSIGNWRRRLIELNEQSWRNYGVIIMPSRCKFQILVLPNFVVVTV